MRPNCPDMLVAPGLPFAPKGLSSARENGGKPVREPRVRAANALALLSVIQGLGADVPRLLDQAGLPQDAWEHPERPLSLYAIDRLLTQAEAATQCDHIGLLVGTRPADLGLPFYMFFNAPDLRTGLENVIALVHLMHEGGSFSLREDAGHATLRYANVAPTLGSARHVTDCVLAQFHAAIVRYCGPRFAAEEIRFPRRAPADLAPYRRHFGRARLVFNEDEAAIEFPASVLAHASAEANAPLYRFLKSRFAKGPDDEPVIARLRRIIGVMVLEGAVDSDRVAVALGLSPRQLRQKLQAEGALLQSLIAEARHETALELLTNTDLALSRIAMAVGYSDVSALSRSFARREGLAPSAFRQRLKTPVRRSA